MNPKFPVGTIVWALNDCGCCVISARVRIFCIGSHSNGYILDGIPQVFTEDQLFSSLKDLTSEHPELSILFDNGGTELAE